MRYFKNVFFLFTSYFLSLIFNLLILKILTNFLPQEALGIYFTYTGGCLIFSQILLIGLPYVFTRYVPYWEEKGELSKVFVLFIYFSFFYLLIFLITILIFSLFPLSNKKIFFLSFLLAYSLSFLTVLTSLFNSFRKMEYSFFINFIYLFSFTLFIYLIREKINIENVLISQIFSLTISNFSGTFSLLKRLKPAICNFKSIWREIRTYWKEAFLLHILSPFFDYTDRIILALFSGFINVSLFTSMRKIIQPLRQILHYPAEAMAPEISARIERFEDFKIYFDIFRKFLFIFSIHLFFFLFLFGKPIISFITNELYLSAYPVLIILCLKIVVSSLYSPYLLLYRSYGRIIHFFYSDFLWILFFLSLAYPSVKYLGIEGLALLHLFSSIAVLIFNYFFIIPHYNVVSRRDFLKIFKYSLSSILPLLILFFYRYLSPFLVLIIFYFFFIILSFIFKPLTEKEITCLKEILNRRWKWY